MVKASIESDLGGQRSVVPAVPEWIGTILFFLAIVFTAAKFNRDFGDNGIVGYAMLILMIAIYAAAIGSAYV